MSSRGIIIEGVTGAGKTHTMKALLANDDFVRTWSPCDVFREKETFGDFMRDLLEQPSAPAARKFRLITSAIKAATKRAEQYVNYRFIMERAHYSCYALLPRWDLYKDFDEQLARLNAHVHLLLIPEHLFRRRSLFRAERQGWGETFIAAYGSEAAALDAIRASQSARYDGIRRSAVAHTVIDTSAKEWDRYAAAIAACIK